MTLSNKTCVNYYCSMALSNKTCVNYYCSMSHSNKTGVKMSSLVHNGIVCIFCFNQYKWKWSSFGI